MAEERSDDLSEIVSMCGLFILVPFVIWFAHRDGAVALTVEAVRAQFWFYTNFISFLVPDTALAKMEYFLRDDSYMFRSKDQLDNILDAWGTAGSGARVVVAPFFIYWLVKLYMKKTRSDYSVPVSRDKLIRDMAPFFANLPPIIGENIHELPLHVGPWRVPRSYLNLAAEQQLMLYKKKDVFPATKWTHKEMSLTLGKRKKKMADQAYLSLNRKKTDEYFANRLGVAFTAFEDMPSDQMKALCGLYCAYIAGGASVLAEVSKAERLMAKSYKMTGSRTEDKGQTFNFDPQPGLELLKKYSNHADVLEVVSSHHFNITVVMGLYTAAGEFAKITTNTVLWCRTLDNRLYRCLVQLGGRAAIPEVAAEWAHFHCELKWGGKIETPVIEGATDAMEQALVSEGWITGPPGMSADPFQSFLGRSHAIAKGEIA